LEGACYNQDTRTRLDFSTLPAAGKADFRRDDQFSRLRHADPQRRSKLATSLTPARSIRKIDP
jgi:hypothetical protein